MKKSAAFTMVALIFTAGANATVLTFDNFDYPDGSLVPNGGWVSHSGTAGDLLVSSGKAVVQHGVPSEDANKPFGPVSGAVYFGIDFSVDDLGGPYTGTDNEYFAHFSDGGTFNFSGRLDVVPPTGAGDFSVGIASTGSTADATWATDLTFGTTYRAIVRYDQDSNQAQLWINAALPTDTSILGADLADPGLAATAFALRQSDSSPNETIRVDGLVVGTTFADVVTAVPEPGTLALLAFGGVSLLRRRR
jgi:hypothetical protein